MQPELLTVVVTGSWVSSHSLRAGSSGDTVGIPARLRIISLVKPKGTFGCSASAGRPCEYCYLFISMRVGPKYYISNLSDVTTGSVLLMYSESVRTEPLVVERRERGVPAICLLWPVNHVRAPEGLVGKNNPDCYGCI